MVGRVGAIRAGFSWNVNFARRLCHAAVDGRCFLLSPEPVYSAPVVFFVNKKSEILLFVLNVSETNILTGIDRLIVFDQLKVQMSARGSPGVAGDADDFPHLYKLTGANFRTAQMRIQ